METTETLRKKITYLHEKHVTLHIDVRLSHPKIDIRGAAVAIKDVYPFLFRVETLEEKTKQCYTLGYADVMTGNIRIAELEQLDRAIKKRRRQKRQSVSGTHESEELS